MPINEVGQSQVRERLCEQIRGVARARDVITYGGLAKEVGKPPDQQFLGGNDYRLHAMLREINDSEMHHGGKPLLLSAVVVRAKERMPGTGFFSDAKRLGFVVQGNDVARREFWEREIERVWEAYSGSDGR